LYAPQFKIDDFPHTGAQIMALSEIAIHSTAISTNGAELLSKTLKKNPNLKFYFKQSYETMEDVLS
jgi:hypothetical protein